jgi:hypothetical protein
VSQQKFALAGNSNNTSRIEHRGLRRCVAHWRHDHKQTLNDFAGDTCKGAWAKERKHTD